MSKRNDRAFPYKEYVCPCCFNAPTECSCGDTMPITLVAIDEGMQEIIRALNEKGYTTQFCCESHSALGNLYIMFSNGYGFGSDLPVPEHFTCRCKGTVIEHVYGANMRERRKFTQEAFEAEKSLCLAELMRWCDSLPPSPNARGWEPEDAGTCPIDRSSTIEDAIGGYICTNCRESLDECTCELFPPVNSWLCDRGIRPHVNVLRDKGYYVDAACEGHGAGGSVLIEFGAPRSSMSGITPPEGFLMHGDPTWSMSFEHRIPEVLDAKEAEADRADAMERLLAWCRSLPALGKR